MSKETWIYLIKDNHTGFYKIGKSINPYKRLSELKRQPTLLPYVHKFELIEAWFGDASDETELHTIFNNDRMRGEWFDLDQTSCSIIEGYFYSNTRLSTRSSKKEEDEAEMPMFYEYNSADILDFAVEGIGYEF